MARSSNRLWFLGAILIALTLASTSYVLHGLNAYATYQESSAAYSYMTNGGVSISWVLPFGPTRALPTAFYTNLHSGIATVSYQSAVPQLLHITVSIPGFTQSETRTVAAGPVWRKITLWPPLLPGALDQPDALTPRAAQVILQVTDMQGHVRYQNSQNIVLLSRQEMIWRDAQGNDHSALLAAWVTPHDPSIGHLVSQAAAILAARYPSTPGMIGYDHATPQDVINQVDAIFDALNADVPNYVNDSMPDLRSGSGEIDETIKLPKDVLSSHSGMCVETTLTMASAILNVGMRPYVMIYPTHAFLAVALGPDANSPRAYWETALGAGHTGQQAYEAGAREHQQYQATIMDIDIVAEEDAGIVPME